MPSITAPVRDFIDESAKISGLELILGELNPIPQTLHPMAIDLPINDNERVGDAIVVQIDVTNAVFKPYARIRIDKIEIALLDKSDQPILVDAVIIGTSGTYRDIVPAGGTALFSGNPFIRTITYDKEGKVILDSNVYARFADVIFKPTPFTTWTFKLADDATVNKVAKLKLTISGAASPAS